MKPNKYRACRTIVDGIRFASKREARRYLDLKYLQLAGAISGLELQPAFKCVVKDVKICVYRADFAYVDKATGELVIEDVKGVKTAVYKLKKRLVKALFGYEIREV